MLAAPVVALVDAPPRDVSAMDGYAVREADLPGPAAASPATAYPGDAGRERSAPGPACASSPAAPVPGRRRPGRDPGGGDARGRCGARSATPGGGRHIRTRGVGLSRTATTAARGGPAARPARAGRRGGRGPRRGRGLAAAAARHLRHRRRAGRARHGARDRPARFPESVSLGVAALAEDGAARSSRAGGLTDDLPELEQMAGRGAGSGRSGRRHRRRLGRREGLRQGDVRAGRARADLLQGRDQAGQAGLARPRGRSAGHGPARQSELGDGDRAAAARAAARGAGRARAPALRWRQAPLAAPLGPCGDRETFVRAGWEGDAVLRRRSIRIRARRRRSPTPTC